MIYRVVFAGNGGKIQSSSRFQRFHDEEGAWEMSSVNYFDALTRRRSRIDERFCVEQQSFRQISS